MFRVLETHMTSTNNKSKIVNAEFDGHIFQDAVRNDMIVYTESAGQNIRLGTGVGGESGLSLGEDGLVVRAPELEVRGGLLRLAGEVHMEGGFRIRNGLAVSGGDTVLSGGDFRVLDADGNDRIFSVAYSSNDGGGPVIISRRNVFFRSNLDVGSNLRVVGDLSVDGRLISSMTVMENDLIVESDARVQGDLRVDGDLYALGSNASIARDLDVGGGLGVEGAARVKGGVFEVLDFESSSNNDDLLFRVREEAVSALRSLRAECNVEVGDGGLSVEGASDLGGGLRVTGGGGLDVRGNTEVHGNFDVFTDTDAQVPTRAFTVEHAEINVRRDAHVACNLYVEGDVDLATGASFKMADGVLLVDGEEGVVIGRDVTVGCNLRVDGAETRLAGDLIVIGSEEEEVPRFAVLENVGLLTSSLDVELTGDSMTVQGTTRFDGDQHVFSGDVELRGQEVRLSEGGNLVLAGGELSVRPRAGDGCNLTALSVTDDEVRLGRYAVADSNVRVEGRLDVGSHGVRVEDGGLEVDGGRLRGEAGCFEADDDAVRMRRSAYAECNMSVGGDVYVTGGTLTVSPDDEGGQPFSSNVVFHVGKDEVRVLRDLVMPEAADFLLRDGTAEVRGTLRAQDRSGADVFSADSNAVIVSRNFSVEGDGGVSSTFRGGGNFEVQTGQTAALLVREGDATFFRPLEVRCNLSVRGGHVDVDGGALRVRPSALLNDDGSQALSVDDFEVAVDRPLVCSRASAFRDDMTVTGGSFAVFPTEGDFDAFVRVSAAEGTRVAGLDVGITGGGDLDVSGGGDVRFSGGILSVTPGQVEALRVSDCNVTVRRDLLVATRDATFDMEDAFVVKNVAGEGGAALEVDASRIRLSRDTRVRCNLDVEGTLQVGAAAGFGDDVLIDGNLRVDTNATIRKKFVAEDDALFERDLLVKVDDDRLFSVRIGETALENEVTNITTAALEVFDLEAEQDDRTTAERSVLSVTDERIIVSRLLQVVGESGAEILGPLSVGADSNGLVVDEAEVVIGRDARARCNLEVAGDLAVDGDTAVGGEVSAGAGLRVDGGEGARVEAGLYVGSNAEVGGDADIGGDLRVSGGAFDLSEAMYGPVARMSASNGVDFYGDVRVLEDKSLTVSGQLSASSGAFTADSDRVSVSERDLYVNAPQEGVFEAGARWRFDTASTLALEIGTQAIRARRHATTECNLCVEGDLAVRGALLVESDAITLGAGDDIDDPSTGAAISVAEGGGRVRLGRNVDIDSNLAVSGDASVGGDFAVNGGGSSTLGGKLSVTTGGLEVVGDALFRGGNTFDVVIEGTDALSVDGARVTLKRDVRMDSNLRIEGGTLVRGGARVLEDFSVRPPASSVPGEFLDDESVLRVTADEVLMRRRLVVDSNADIGRDLAVGRDLAIGRDVTADGALTVAASAHVGATLTVDGDTEMSGEFTVNPGNGTDALAVRDADVQVTRPLNVVGDVDVTGRLIVTEGGTLSFSVDESEATINRDLAVNGQMVVQDGLDVGFDVAIGRNTSVGSNLDVGSNLTVDANAEIFGNARVQGSTSLFGEFNLDTGGTAAVRVDDDDMRVFRDLVLRDGVDLIVEGGGVSVDGDISSTGTTSMDRLLLVAGSSDRPALAFQSSNATGLFMTTAGYVTHQVDGVEALTLLPAGAARIPGALTAGELIGDGAGLSNLDADHVTSGTLAVARGGTGCNAHEPSRVLVGNGTSPVRSASDLRYELNGEGVGKFGIALSNDGDILDTLHVGGGVRSERTVFSSPGSTDALSLAFSDSGVEDTGFYRDGQGRISFSVEGARNFSVTSEGLEAVYVVASSLFGDGSNIDGLDADRVAHGVLAVPRGGTGGGQHTASKVLVGDGEAAVRSPANLHWDFENQRLGVGMTEPLEALHVQGGARATRFYGDGNNLSNLNMGAAETGLLAVERGGTGIGNLGADKLMVGSGTGTVRTPTELHWDAANLRLGVGTSSPQEAVHVDGTVRAVLFSGDGRAVTDLDMDAATAGVLALERGGTGVTAFSSNAVLIGTGPDAGLRSATGLYWNESNTRLGVGTDSPEELVHVDGTLRAVRFVGEGSAVTDLDMDAATAGVLSVRRGGTGADVLSDSKLLVGSGDAPVRGPTTLHWDAANARLGIGTEFPDSLLHVNGTLTANRFAGDGNSVTNLDMDSASTGVLSVPRGGVGTSSFGMSKLLVGMGTGAVESPEGLHWKDTPGFLGIGMVTPEHMLDVSGVTRAQAFIGDGRDVQNLDMRNVGLGELAVTRGGTGRPSLSASKLMVGDGTDSVLTPTLLHWDRSRSNLGIGTDAPDPDARLHVNGTLLATAFDGDGSRLRDLDVNNVTSGTLDVASGGTGRTSHAGSKLLVGNDMEGIDSPANLHWNAATDSLGVNEPNPAFNLHVRGTLQADELRGDGAELSNLDVNNVALGILALARGGTGTNDAALEDDKIVFKRGDQLRTSSQLHWDSAVDRLGVRMSDPEAAIHVDGEVWATEDIISEMDVIALSDVRLKRDVERIDRAMDRVRGMTGYTYVLRKDPRAKRRTGLLAQDVLEHLPEAVTASEREGMLRLAYGNMMGLMVEALKELGQEVEDVRRDVALLSTNKRRRRQLLRRRRVI